MDPIDSLYFRKSDEAELFCDIFRPPPKKNHASLHRTPLHIGISLCDKSDDFAKSALLLWALHDILPLAYEQHTVNSLKDPKELIQAVVKKKNITHSGYQERYGTGYLHSSR